MIAYRVVAIALWLAVVSALPVRADLSKARAEPNLERRARMALDNGRDQFRAASQAYKSGDWPKTTAALQELVESVDLADASLKATGKNPRNSGQFKNLEIKSRDLLKSVEDLRREMAFEEREQLQPLVDHLRQVHDEVLESVMSGSKRKAK